MELAVHGRNIEITDWIEEYVDKKVSKLDRFINGGVDDVRAELSQSDTRAADDRYTFQITMRTDRQILRAEESSGDIFASIDAAVDKLRRQVKRAVDRKRSRRRHSIATNTEAVLAEAELFEGLGEEGSEGRILRRKKFLLNPMTEDEAVDQMELLGHDFFLFYNEETNSTNLIYRRKDGNYGLLQPDL